MEDLGVKAGPEANDLLASRLKDMVIKRAGGLGRQISDKDREFLRSISGAMMTDPVALRRILAISAAQDMLTVDRHNQSVQDMRAKSPDMEAALAWTVDIGSSSRTEN